MNPITKIRANMSRSAQGLLADQKGNAVVEYAIIIGVVVLGAIACASMIGQEMIPKTNQVAVALDGGSLTAPNASNPSGAAGRSGVVDGSTVQVSPTSRIPDIVLMLGYGIAVVAFVIAWRPRKQKSKKRAAPVERDADQFARNRLRIHAVLKSLRNEKVKSPIRVEHVMDTRFNAVRPNTRRADVILQLKASATGVLLVTDDSGRLHGTIEQADLDATTANVAGKISREVTDQLEAKAYLSSAIELAHRHQLRLIPVLTNGVVQGVVSTGDLLATLLCTLQMINEIDDEYRIILQRAVGLAEHA